MLSSYVIGNLLGRLLLSYVLVWVVCLGLAKGDWRAAFASTRRGYGLLGVLLVFLLGLAGTVGRGFGGAA